MLLEKISSVDEMQNDIQRLLWISTKSPLQRDREIATTQLSILKKRMQDVRRGFEYGCYKLSTDDILSEYRKLNQTTKARSFVAKSKPVSHEVRTRLAKLHLSYLQIASEYVPITNISVISNNLNLGSTLCNVCYGSSFEQLDDGRSICNDCFTEIEILEDTASFKDGDRVKLAPRYKYTTRGYFIDAMNNLECKQNKDVDGIVPEILREIKMQSQSPETITLQQFYNIILDLKLNDYYNDVYLLYFKITKKLIFNITSLRSEMTEMHDMVSEVYEEIKDDDNAQNVYMKIFKILQLLDYPCTRDQFFYLRDIDNEEKHNRKWKQQMEILAQRYPDQKTPNGKARWRYIASY
jgi:hypothetical protein